MITFEINGKKCRAEPGTMVIQVADEAGIPIPRFCYHPKLSIAANCRMCLVEVEKAPKPLPACATPVMEGMKVFTNSVKAVDAQKAVLEFLLINHPLDCPICDQGGECELQDLTLEYGKDASQFTEGKRAVKDLDIGPLVKTEMTRCIHCTRCVRFGAEIAGMRELGVVGRGERLEIGTFLEKNMNSELSGNVIDVCPVGALVARPSRHTARPWELKQTPSIAPHDCVGSHINIHTLRGVVKRIVPAAKEDINEVWISDRDRFSYCGLASPDRVLQPQIRKNGIWQIVDWETALQCTVDGLKDVIEQQGAQAVGALASPSATVEELYLFQKWLRGLGVTSIDHRLRQTDLRGEADCPTLGLSLVELEQCDTIILIGSNSRKEQPMLNHRIRKAALKGANVIVINSKEYEFNFRTVKELTPKTAELAEQGKKVAVLLGSQALNHANASLLETAAKTLASVCGGTFGKLTEGANAAGAFLAGVLPEKGGLDAQAMLKASLKARVLLGVEPEDCADPDAMIRSLSTSDFVVAFSAFKGEALNHHADVILPIAAFAEFAGTFVNGEGKWQSFEAAAVPLGEAKTAWEVLQLLADFKYNRVEEVRDKLRQKVTSAPVMPATALIQASSQGILQQLQELAKLINQGPMIAPDACQIDSLVRRSEPLQNRVKAS